MQRIHAELCRHGVTLPETSIRCTGPRELFEDDGFEISPAGRQPIVTAYRMIDAMVSFARPGRPPDRQRTYARQRPGRAEDCHSFPS
jgi:hypothetical protein